MFLNVFFKFLKPPVVKKSYKNQVKFDKVLEIVGTNKTIKIKTTVLLKYCPFKINASQFTNHDALNSEKLPNLSYKGKFALSNYNQTPYIVLRSIKFQPFQAPHFFSVSVNNKSIEQLNQREIKLEKKITEINSPHRSSKSKGKSVSMYIQHGKNSLKNIVVQSRAVKLKSEGVYIMYS